MPDMTDLGVSPGFDSLQDITDDTEDVETVLVSERGLTKTAGNREQHIDYAVGMVVTDRRILFVTLDSEREGDRGELTYDDLAGVDRMDGALELTTTDGVVWQFPLSGTDHEAVDAASRHLRWIGEVRSRVVSSRNDVEMAAGQMRTRANDLKWDRAADTYHAARQRLDDLICTVQYTERLDNEILAPELADIERTLEAAYARLYVERAKSQLDLGRHLVENEDYEQARKVLEQAQAYYEQARDRSDVIERGDAFQFGTQRELQTDLEDLGWEIETVAAEPIRQAHDEKIQAQRTDDPETEIEHWEAAFRGYGNVLTLEWGDDERHFAGDPEAVRAEMQQAAEQLIELHEQGARETWNTGAKLEQQGETAASLERCKSATEHLERAHELAEEFEPDRTTELGTRLGKMFESLIEIRDAMKESRSKSESTDEQAGTMGTDGERSEESSENSKHDEELENDEDEWPPTVSELSEMDTHHEITLELEDVTETVEDNRDEDEDADSTTGERDADTTESETEKTQSNFSL
jgi:tetratricopeptide (TPR) repeat protein